MQGFGGLAAPPVKPVITPQSGGPKKDSGQGGLGGLGACCLLSKLGGLCLYTALSWQQVIEQAAGQHSCDADRGYGRRGGPGPGQAIRKALRLSDMHPL